MQRLKRYLEEEGLTQAEFADLVGVKQPSVWEWVNGESKPSADRLIVISRVTRISIDELLTDKPPSVH